MTIRHAFYLALIFICLILMSCGAGEDNDEDSPGIDDYIRQGKSHLTTNESLYAEKAFESALDIKSDSHDAKFGLFLARLIRLPNLIDQIVGTISSISFEDQANDQMTKSLSIGTSFDNSIHEYLYENVGGRLTDNEVLYDALAVGSDFDFDLARYAISIGESDLMAFSGHFDKCDLYFFGSMDALMNALVNYLLALDLSFDQQLLILPDTEELNDTTETVLAYVELIENLLLSEVEPNFLMYRQDGAEYLQQTGMDLGNAFARLSAAYDCMSSALLERPMFQFHYFDRNADEAYSPFKDPVFIGDTIELSPDAAASLQYIAQLLPDAFYEGSELDADPTVATITLADFNELLYSLGLLPLQLGPITIDNLPAVPEINLGDLFVDPDPESLQNALLVIIDLIHLALDA
jgi:hypothetical protein